MPDLPRNGELLKLAERFPTNQSLADHLGCPRTTLRDHIKAIGAREAVQAIRHQGKEVGRPKEVPIIRRDYSHQEKHYVYPLGDVHKGSPSHDPLVWRNWVAYLEQRPETSLLGTGDFFNAALKDSKSETYDEVLNVGSAKRVLRGELSALADDERIDCMCPGNHEDRIYRAAGDCPVRDLCDILGIPYFEAAALLVYTVGDVEYEIYVRHGTGMGQSLATLAKSGFVIRADVYVTGHTHRQAVTADDFFARQGNEVGRDKRYFVSSGSFLGYEKYAAVRGYPPSRIGAPRIFLDGRRKDIHISI